MSTLNCAVLFPRTPIRQLRSVPAPAFPLRKLRLRAVGVVCARNDSNAGVEKLGKASPGRGDGDGSPERVAEDPRLRLELKAKIGSLECNAQRARGGERVRGHTVGVDLGDAKTGLAISLGGYAPRPLTVSFCAIATFVVHEAGVGDTWGVSCVRERVPAHPLCW